MYSFVFEDSGQTHLSGSTKISGPLSTFYINPSLLFIIVYKKSNPNKISFSKRYLDTESYLKGLGVLLNQDQLQFEKHLQLNKTHEFNIADVLISHTDINNPQDNVIKFYQVIGIDLHQITMIEIDKHVIKNLAFSTYSPKIGNFIGEKFSRPVIHNIVKVSDNEKASILESHMVKLDNGLSRKFFYSYTKISTM